jgi:PASTA domain
MAKEIKLPGIGEVPLWTAGAGAAAVVAIIVVYSRRAKAATAAAAAQTASTAAQTVTDPSGNVCAALAPSGYCPGSPEDEAYTANEEGESGYDDAGLSGYTGMITDSNGETCVALDPATGLCPVSSTTGLTTNQQWVTAAENQLGLTPTVQAALGYALSGQPVTSAQASLFNEAVGLLGAPPQGYPPLNVTGTAAQSSGGTVPVPSVTGQSVAAATSALQAAGFTASVSGSSSGTVWSQTPAAGYEAPPGGSVDIAASASGKPPEVPSVMGLSVQAAISALQAAGYTYKLSGPASGKIWSQTPQAGFIAPAGNSVDIASSATGKAP